MENKRTKKLFIVEDTAIPIHPDELEVTFLDDEGEVIVLKPSDPLTVDFQEENE